MASPLPAACGTVTIDSGGTLTCAGGSTCPAGTGTVTSVVIAGTSNQIAAGGTCTITSTGTCTLSLLAAQILGTDNSTAGTLQLANGSANAHTIWGSAATTSNTILGFATAPTTTDLLECVTASTTCTLTDTGVLTGALVTAGSNFTSGDLVQAAGNNKTTSDSSIATANVVTAASNFGSTQVVYGGGANKTTASSANLTFSSPVLTVGASGTAGTFRAYNNTNYTNWTSAATTSNTIAGFATVPTTGDIPYCVVSSTTCTLTDSSIVYSNIVTASSNFTNAAMIVAAGANKTTQSWPDFTFDGTHTGSLGSSGILDLSAATISNVLFNATGFTNGHLLSATVSGGKFYFADGGAVPGTATTVNGQTCTLGSTCAIESATSGQVAISGGSGAALTGASDLTYSTHTFSGISTTIFDLHAATGTAAFKVPSNSSNTATAAGVIDFDTTGTHYHVYDSGADDIICTHNNAECTGSGTVTVSGSPSANYMPTWTSGTNLTGTAAPTTVTGVPWYWSYTTGTGYGFGLAGVPVNPNSETTCSTLTLNILDRASQINCSGGTTSAVSSVVHSTAGFGANYVFDINNQNSGTATFTPTTDTCNGSSTCTILAGWYGRFTQDASGNWHLVRWPTDSLYTGLSTGIQRVTTTTGAISSAELSGDCTTSGSNAVTCLKTNGSSFTALATTAPGTGVATWLATPSGANLASALTSALPVTVGGTGLTGGSANKVLGGATPSMVTVTSGYVDGSICTPGAPASQTDGTTITWAIGTTVCANGKVTFTAHGGSRTLNVTGMSSGGYYSLIATQDATGSENLVLGTGCTWVVNGAGSTTLTLSTAANGLNVLTWEYDGTTCYLSNGLYK